MQIRPDRAPEPAPLVAALPVVPEACDDSAERLGARVEASPARVVLEAGDRTRVARIELALEEHVADHPPLARDGLEGQQPDAGHVFAVEAAIAASEQLVAAAHRKERRAAGGDCLFQRLGLRREVAGHEQLLAILAATHVIQIVRTGHDRIAHAELGQLEVMPAPRRPARQHRDVAAVGVDVQVVRVEVADANRRHAARSQ